jgi:hypothetical protein
MLGRALPEFANAGNGFERAQSDLARGRSLQREALAASRRLGSEAKGGAGRAELGRQGQL